MGDQATDRSRDLVGSRDFELGWVIVGRPGGVAREAVTFARRQVRRALHDQLPGIGWRMPLVLRADFPAEPRLAPMTLVELGVGERSARHWDFAIVVTAADLFSNVQGGALATPSHALATAVVSTARIDPGLRREDVDAPGRASLLGTRIASLVLHLLGDLCGVAHDDEPGWAMTRVQPLHALDTVPRFSEPSARALRRALTHLAASPLEDLPDSPGPVEFYLRAAWRNASMIAKVIRRIRPWRLPLHLTRFTTAAVSSMVVLMMTAESWQIAMHLSGPSLLFINVATLASAFAYTAMHLRLFLPKEPQLVERVAAARVSSFLALIIALISAYATLFAVCVVSSALVFPVGVVRSWADVTHVGVFGPLRLGAFVAAISLTIAALGGSFESSDRVRNLVYIDEER